MRAGTRRGHASHLKASQTLLQCLNTHQFRVRVCSASTCRATGSGKGRRECSDQSGGKGRANRSKRRQDGSMVGELLAGGHSASSRILTSAVKWLMLSVRAERASSWAKARVALRASLRS